MQWDGGRHSIFASSWGYYPQTPSIINFRQGVNLWDFLRRVAYIVRIMANKRYIVDRIRTQDEANAHMVFIVNYIDRTPSRASKLPKMVVERVRVIKDFWRRGR